MITEELVIEIAENLNVDLTENEIKAVINTSTERLEEEVDKNEKMIIEDVIFRLKYEDSHDFTTERFSNDF
jgi:nucleoid DNA-binding protein